MKNLLQNLRYFTYTHSNMEDVWPIYLGQLEKFSPNIKHTMIVDKEFDLERAETLVYDEEANYCAEYVKCLTDSSIQEDYVTYMQEDFFLYNPVDLFTINRYLNVLEQDPELSFIRLVKQPAWPYEVYGPQHFKELAAIGALEKQILDCVDIYIYREDETLFWVRHPEELHTGEISYSMQPTIWKRSHLINLYNTCGRQKFGEGADWTDAMNKCGIKGLYHYNNEERRGTLHFDSNVFPYTLTGIVKSMWNTFEYPELTEMLNQYGIDQTIRGELTPEKLETARSWYDNE